MPGDVDIVLASELMEAGRAVQRGFVTPDRTTLLASTHRVYSIAEKSAMGDGRVDSEALLKQAGKAAKRFVSFDMAQAAEQSGSVISAVLFGALCGTGVLPFSRAQFEATIERGGVGVKPSLRAFASGCARVRAEDEAGLTPVTAPVAPQAAQVATPRSPQVAALLERARREIPAPARTLVVEGIRRLIDYQDPAYAKLYLDRLARLAAQPGADDAQLLGETARHLALWMSYEDTIRVADLKTRDTRFERVRGEVRAKDDQLLRINEFMHPRLEEICETMPAPLGRWLMKPHLAHRLVARFTRSGRVVSTSSLGGYLLLYTLARWRVGRRSTLRFAMETEHIEDWLQRVAIAARSNPALALEVAQCQRLVKGYGDTHARGFKNYQTLMRVVERQKGTLAPATLRELRSAALADEHGNKLHESLVRQALA
jgi:indolepyruvate ferredoxin oxidoreductase beta subunit